jgi:hypothetical protein
MRKLVLIAALVAVAVAVAPGVASAFSCGVSLDKFNRADSADLGPNWAQQANAIGISGNAATNAAANPALATFSPRGGSEACLDVSTGGTGLRYAGLVLRYGDIDNSIFIKVQNNAGSDSTFDTAFFYRGNNGSGTPTTLRSPAALTDFTSGRIHVWSKGTKARLDIDTDFDNKPEQSFNVTGIDKAGLGTLFGISSYNGAISDNFRTAPPQTTITKHPSKTTSSNSATFKFKSSISGSHFKCKLDGQNYKSCGSPRSYSNLSNGNHTFRVKAIDQFGNPDPTPAKFSWRIT